MKRTVEQYMDKRPFCFNENDRVNEVIEIMTKDNLTHAIITDSAEKAVGVVSRKDMLDFLLELIKNNGGSKYCELEINNTKLKYIMTKTPVVVKESDDMEDATRVLNKYKFHCLPVVNDSGQINGIITFFDLILGLMDQMNPPVHGFTPSRHFRSSTWLKDYSWTI